MEAEPDPVGSLLSEFRAKVARLHSQDTLLLEQDQVASFCVLLTGT